MEVKKTRKRQDSDIAAGGNLNVFLGRVIRQKLEIISEHEGKSMAYLVRLSLSQLISSYTENEKLPDWTIKDYKGRGPGRRRKFESLEDAGL